MNIKYVFQDVFNSLIVNGLENTNYDRKSRKQRATKLKRKLRSG